MKHHLRIRKDGVIEWLAPPPVPFKIQKQTRTRFSEIVPSNHVKCVLFRILRFVFGETGRVSDWTRSWCCLWHGEILQGPHKGETMESGLRCVLLEWEKHMWVDNGDLEKALEQSRTNWIKFLKDYGNTTVGLSYEYRPYGKKEMN